MFKNLKLTIASVDTELEQLEFLFSHGMWE